MKFFQNKFFIIALSVVVFLAILTATLAVMGQTDPVKNLLNTVSVPFRYVGTRIKDGFEGFSKYFESIKEMDARNRELKAEVDRLEKELADAQAIEEENERLRSYLEIKRTYPDFEMMEAMVIGNESDNYMSVFTLNRGIGDGVELGMPIITPEGLVGSVCEVGYTWCKVRALTEASSSAGACVSRSGELGLIDGDIALKGTGTCKLTYLDPDADVMAGDLVYTDGMGSVYPRGLLIGRVISVENNEYLRTKTATVECAVEIGSLKYVIIVTDFEIATEE